MKHIREIFKKPHPIGSDEHKRVRNYIIDEMQKLGLKTELHRETTNNFYKKKGTPQWIR